jgi:acyl-CoA dehydrogenase
MSARPTEARYRRIQEEALSLAAKVRAYAAEADSASEVHQSALRDLRACGLARLNVPAAYGGRFKAVDPVAICLVREVLMPVSAQMDSLFAMQGIGSYPITLAGTPAQKNRWLPQVAAMEALAALALTEPNAGSDLRGITTSIKTNKNGLRLSGVKSFITNAPVAAFFTTLVRENGELSMVLVPADAPGVSVEAGPELSAPHVIGTIAFDGVRLPHNARLGKVGHGLDYALGTLAIFRASVGAAAVGLAQRALDEAVRHTSTRHQFGRPLARQGAVAGMLVDSWADIEMARLLVYRAATMARESAPDALVQSSLAKLAATEAAGRVVDRCVQMMGRFGLVRGSIIERLNREARPLRIYEGASEVLRTSLSRTLTEKMPAVNSGPKR